MKNQESDRGQGLGWCGDPLQETYDLAMLDLDGVVYIGPEAVPGAPQHLGRATAAGMRLSFVTNNASRPPDAVAEHLVELGIPAEARDVVTSAQAAARLLSQRLAMGARVFVIGGTGLERALEERDLVPVRSSDDSPVAVVSGFSPDLRWSTVIDGAQCVRDGLPWIASNTDLTVPTPRGPGPGNGVLVKVVADFAGVSPTVAGKPEPPLFHETLDRVGGRRPLVVGDRLDTDIEGGVRAGFDTLLVLTGVTDLRGLVAADRGCRPTYVSPDLGGLSRPQPPVTLDEDTRVCGGWAARVSRGRLTIEGDGSLEAWWRAVAVAAWSHLDEHGEPVSIGRLAPPEAVQQPGEDVGPR